MDPEHRFLCCRKRITVFCLAGFLLRSMVLFADSLPIVSTGPQSLTVSASSNVVLSVSATAATGYQWRFNGVDIPSGTNVSLTITNAQVTNSGYYVVIAKNALGWAPSLPAYLSVVDTAGLVPFSNKFYSNAIAVYLFGDGSDRQPVTSGTAQLIAGPALDQMQVVPGLSLAVQNGFFGARTPTVPNVAAGQTLYYRVSVSYTQQFQLESNVSTVLKLIAGGGTNPIPIATNFYFPAWLEWPDYDPSFYVDAPATNQVRVVGETFAITNAVFGFTDLGIPVLHWRKDGKKIGSPINYPPAPYYTNISLTISNAQASDAGVYDLEYLGNNWIIGPKTLLTVQVTNGQGVLQSPRPVGTNFCFDLLCAPRRKYLVQWSSNLVNWIDVQTVTNLNQNTTLTMTITNPPSPNGAAFYRSRLLP